LRLIPRFPFYRKGGDYITSLQRRLNRIEDRVSHLLDKHILLGGTESVISQNGKQVELTKDDFLLIMEELTREVWSDYTADHKLIKLLRNCKAPEGSFASYIQRGWLSDRTRK